MKKIGIILQSTNCSTYLYETVHELFNSKQVEIYFLLNNQPASQSGIWRKVKTKIGNEGFIRTIELSFFKWITSIEYKLLSRSNEKIREHHKTLSISEFSKNDIIYLNPVFSSSGLIVRYGDEDINKIKSINLDIIIRGNALGIFKGKILGAAKEGIISFHHGDNRWNRGGPPAFWEVYLKKSSTGFIIQRLTEELDGGNVLFRGNIETKLSYTENLVNLCSESNPYLAQLIKQYAESNKFPEQEEKFPFSDTILKAPSFSQTVLYMLREGFLFAGNKINKISNAKYYRWSIAFISGTWNNAALRKGIQVKNPPDRFFADPFVITKNDRTICYVEDFYYNKGKGCITAIEILDKKNYKVLGPVIDEPFHLSFPYIFYYQDNLYMIPESFQSNSIRLYKCVEFPLRWEYQKDILSGIEVVDTMIFFHNGKWWLLTNLKSNLALIAYYSEDPLTGTWIPHEKNPLVIDSDISRNGGILDVSVGFPVRCRQKQGFNLYGASLTLARITDLTSNSFSEKNIGQILPNFFPKIKGCHHIHSNEKYTVYDYVRYETRH